MCYYFSGYHFDNDHCYWLSFGPSLLWYSKEILVKVKLLVAQSHPTLCNPMDCSPRVSSIHEIFQARILEWIAIPFSRGSSQPRDCTWVSRTAGRFFTNWASREVQYWPRRYPNNHPVVWQLKAEARDQASGASQFCQGLNLLSPLASKMQPGHQSYILVD